MKVTVLNVALNSLGGATVYIDFFLDAITSKNMEISQ